MHCHCFFFSCDPSDLPCTWPQTQVNISLPMYWIYLQNVLSSWASLKQHVLITVMWSSIRQHVTPSSLFCPSSHPFHVPSSSAGRLCLYLFASERLFWLQHPVGAVKPGHTWTPTEAATADHIRTRFDLSDYTWFVWYLSLLCTSDMH